MEYTQKTLLIIKCNFFIAIILRKKQYMINIFVECFYIFDRFKLMRVNSDLVLCYVPLNYERYHSQDGEVER